MRKPPRIGIARRFLERVREAVFVNRRLETRRLMRRRRDIKKLLFHLKKFFKPLKASYTEAQALTKIENKLKNLSIIIISISKRFYCPYK